LRGSELNPIGKFSYRKNQVQLSDRKKKLKKIISNWRSLCLQELKLII
jgi:hypothetical protein